MFVRRGCMFIAYSMFGYKVVCVCTYNMRGFYAYCLRGVLAMVVEVTG